MKTMVTRISHTAALLSLFSFLFLTGTPAAQAADCTSFGYAQISADKLTVPKGGSVTITSRYKWGASPAPASCYDQSVSLFQYVNGVIHGDRTDIGAVQRDGDTITENNLDYTELVNGSSSTAQIEVEYFTTPTSSTPKQTLAKASITVNLESDKTTYGCVAADSKYACSPDGTLKGCQDNLSCQSSKNPKAGCTLLADKDKCGQFAPTTPGGPPGGSTGAPGSTGRSVSFSFSIPNPLKADDFMGLISAIATWIFNLSIPVAVIVIVWAGLRFLWARGNPGEVASAKQMLTYAVIGLVIIFIGRGFITLIQSIINLGAK